MHEFAIGEELVKAVLGEMARLTPPYNLTSVRVVVGALRQVVPENLIFAYEVFSRDTPASGSALEITMLPVTVLCRACGWQGEIEGRLFLCSICGAVNLQTLQGMELFLDRLEVEYNDQDGN